MTTLPVFILSLLVASPALAQISYHDLALRDLDEMVGLVKGKIEQSRGEGTDMMAPLKEGVRLVFSRPDDDGMIDKVVGPLRSEIEQHEDWETVLSGLVDESVSLLKDPKDVKASDQVGHVIFLRNVIASLKPRAKKKDPKSIQILEKIRDAKIELSKEMKNERKLRVMKETASPSKLAEQALP